MWLSPTCQNAWKISKTYLMSWTKDQKYTWTGNLFWIGNILMQVTANDFYLDKNDSSETKIHTLHRYIWTQGEICLFYFLSHECVSNGSLFLIGIYVQM